MAKEQVISDKLLKRIQTRITSYNVCYTKLLRIEYRMVDPAGALQWLLSHGQVERDVNDKALRIRGVSIDITKRKRTEAALYKSEHFARTLLNTTDAMTHILDEEGIV